VGKASSEFKVFGAVDSNVKEHTIARRTRQNVTVVKANIVAELFNGTIQRRCRLPGKEVEQVGALQAVDATDQTRHGLQVPLGTKVMKYDSVPLLSVNRP